MLFSRFRDFVLDIEIRFGMGVPVKQKNAQPNNSDRIAEYEAIVSPALGRLAKKPLTGEPGPPANNFQNGLIYFDSVGFNPCINDTHDRDPRNNVETASSPLDRQPKRLARFPPPFLALSHLPPLVPDAATSVPSAAALAGTPLPHSFHPFHPKPQNRLDSL